MLLAVVSVSSDGCMHRVQNQLKSLFKWNKRFCASETRNTPLHGAYVLFPSFDMTVWNVNSMYEVLLQIKWTKQWTLLMLIKCAMLQRWKSSESDGVIISFCTLKIISSALSHEIAFEKSCRVIPPRVVCVCNALESILLYVKDIYECWHCFLWLWLELRYFSYCSKLSTLTAHFSRCVSVIISWNFLLTIAGI